MYAFLLECFCVCFCVTEVLVDKPTLEPKRRFERDELYSMLPKGLRLLCLFMLVIEACFWVFAEPLMS